MNQKGFIIPLIIIILIIAALIGGYVFVQHRKLKNESVPPTSVENYLNKTLLPMETPNEPPNPMLGR